MPLNTPSIFLDYLDDKFTFIQFVESVMKSMKKEANTDKSKLVGGAFVFIHYQVDLDQESNGRLLILMVDKKGVFDFNENLVPKKIHSVDIDALRQAALIDLTLFKSSYPENEGEPYLHFIAGKSRSEFFKRALGCNAKIDNNRSIKQLLDAIDGFSNAIGLTTEERVDVRESVKLYMDTKARHTDKKMTINDIGKNISKCIPKRKRVEDRFNQYIETNEYVIDDYFEPVYSSGKIFGEIKIMDDDNEYEFICNVNTIGNENNSGKKIIYDKDNALLIVRLTDSGIREIEKIIK